MSAEALTPAEGRLRLFEAVGVEIEYMLVDRSTLAVLPRTDEVLRQVAGAPCSEVDAGELTWSNELVLHQVELRTKKPAAEIDPLLPAFEGDVRRINQMLEPLGGRLMPTAMHPLMDPLTETRLWPHAPDSIYEAFNRVFDCHGHGWSNLQSLHLDLPFADDEEFARLHAGVRLVLPLLPALAASSPLVEGRFTASLDNRMELYRATARKIPSAAGFVVPERVWSRAAYEKKILAPLYRDVAAFDPDRVLADELLNTRGAIPRFGRGVIEIRVIDVQECPKADLAIVLLVTEVLKLLAEERWCSLEDQQSFETPTLSSTFHRAVLDADRAKVHDRAYLEALGVTDHATLDAGDVWRHLVEEVFAGVHAPDESWRDLFEEMLDKGPLARRIRRALPDEPRREEILEVYGRLCDCLEEGELFDA